MCKGRTDFSGNWENFHEISTHRAAEYGSQINFLEKGTHSGVRGIIVRRNWNNYRCEGAPGNRRGSELRSLSFFLGRDAWNEI